jgi:hypothetical protein
MIELNEKSWEEFSHAYGKATVIPALLEKLPGFPMLSNYLLGSTQNVTALWQSYSKYDIEPAAVQMAVIPLLIFAHESTEI